jgi:hypothetical protein
MKQLGILLLVLLPFAVTLTGCGLSSAPSSAEQTATWESQKHEIFAELTMSAVRATEFAPTPVLWMTALARGGAEETIQASLNAP